MKKSKLLVAVAFIAFLNVPTFSVTPSIINKGWEAPPKIFIYPTSNPPAYLGYHEACCQAEFKANGQYKYVCKDGKIWVTELRLEISGSSTITLPSDYNQLIKDHEMGHYYLNRLEYTRYAEEKLREIFKDFGKPRELAPIEDCETAVAWLKSDYECLLDEWIDAMAEQTGVLDEKYDSEDCTNHSNGPLSWFEGYNKVKNDRLKAERFKKYGTEDPNATPHPDPQVGPDWNKPVASGVGIGRFDPNSILVSPPFNIDDIGNIINPDDPVKDCKIKIDDLFMLFKTVKPSQTHKFTDGGIKIFHPSNPDEELLLGTIYNNTLEPSTVPPYEWMIQGVFDVWYVNNVIGSEFISELEIAYSKDDYLSVWMFINEIPIDADSRPIDIDFPAYLYIGIADNLSILKVDDFESYDLVSSPINNQWSAQSIDGIVELWIDPVSLNQSMWATIDWNMEPSPEYRFTKTMNIPHNWCKYDAVEVWIDLIQYANYDIPVLEQILFIEVRDIHGITQRYDLDTLGDFQGHALIYKNSDYHGISIDINEFSIGGIDLSHIMEFTIGVKKNPGNPPIFSGKFDDIFLVPASQLEALKSDIDENKIVNLMDFVIFAEEWLSTPHTWPQRNF